MNDFQHYLGELVSLAKEVNEYANLSAINRNNKYMESITDDLEEQLRELDRDFKLTVFDQEYDKDQFPLMPLYVNRGDPEITDKEMEALAEAVIDVINKNWDKIVMEAAQKVAGDD